MKLDLNELSKVQIVSEMSEKFKEEMTKTVLQVYHLTMNDLLTLDDLENIASRYGIDDLAQVYYDTLNLDQEDD